MTALTVLEHFLDTSEIVAPRSVEELTVVLSLRRSTTYAALHHLERRGLVIKVKGGYILGKKVLLAGVKYHAQLSRIQLKDMQEKIYGSAGKRSN